MGTEQLHERGRGEGLLRWSLGDDFFVQPDDVAGIMGGQGQIVGHHELGEALLPPGAVKDFPEQAFALEVHSGGGFVQQQDLGFPGQGRGQQDATQLSTGQVTHAAADEMLRMYGGQGRTGTPGGTGLDAQPERTALVSQGKKLGHGQGQGTVHPQVLRHIGQTGLVAVAVPHTDLAGIDDLVDDAMQQGTFTRAVGTDQNRAAPLWDGGRDVLQDMEIPATDVHMGDMDGRGRISVRGHVRGSGSCGASAVQNSSQAHFPVRRPWNPSG